ncbi:OVARIAN TUMOR DOMAIN-containing deubiquitinating enzyme 3 [Ancistrocladus abbreviatus]
MAAKPFNDSILEQLRNGTAQFELVCSPVRPLFDSSTSAVKSKMLLEGSSRFFARIGPQLGGASAAMKKMEHYAVQRVTGDGRCMFRALVKGMAMNKGITLSPHEEREDADDLRMAVKEVLCQDDKEQKSYEEALVAITVDEPLNRYCQRIGRADFWGGESELLVLSKLCHQPIIVYIPEHEHTRNGRGSGFIPIAEYGAEHRKGSGKRKPRKVVRLLYSGRNHYDLLV